MFKKFIFILLSGLSLSANQGQFAKVNNIDIWYESFGQKENPALLLLSGGCNQSVMWHDDFCERLANEEGFYVIRYDHRDTGLSSSIDFEKNPYDVMDMAKDAIGVLDAAGVEQAHLFGVSLGGFLSEIISVYYPERVYTITLLGSSPDIHPSSLAYANLPPDEDAIFSSPREDYLVWMKEWLKLSPQTYEEQLDQRLDGWSRLNGKVYPLNEKMHRDIHEKFLARHRNPQGILNHIAMLASESSEDLVRAVPAKITVPTVIIHGSEDPIFPPDHGKALSLLINDSEYFFVEGMGHVPNEHFYDLYVDILNRQAAKFR